MINRLKSIGFITLFGILLGGCGSIENKEVVAADTAATTTSLVSDETETTTETKKKEVALEMEDLSAYIHLMDHVSPDMLSGDYWIQKLTDADEVMMSSAEISSFNDDILYEKAEHYKFLDLAKGDVDSMEGETLKAYLEESVPMEDAYFKDGTSISSSYWDTLVDNENIDGIASNQKVSFGFAVKRECLYQFPTEDIITLDHPYTFFNENQCSSILYGEPVIKLHESKDGEWYYVISQAFGGWMKKEYIALCENKEDWDEHRNPDKFLVVTDDEFSLEYDPKIKENSELELSMGAKLMLVPAKEYTKSEEGRVAYGNYVVKLPTRGKDGMVTYQHAYVPVSKGVHVGYLDYTKENILKLAFASLGDRYGWGGQYNARDCSQYIMEIYRCFGISLPRNSSGLAKMNCKTIDVEGLSDSEKEEKLEQIPVGSILYLKGHVMLYLGEEDGKHYVISSMSSFIREDGGDVIMAESVAINTLDIRRRNGNSWLESLLSYKIILP